MINISRRVDLKKGVFLSLFLSACSYSQTLYVTHSSNLYQVDRQSGALSLKASDIQSGFHGSTSLFYEQNNAYIAGTRQSPWDENLTISSLRTISLTNGLFSDLNIDRLVSGLIKNGNSWYGFRAGDMVSINPISGQTQIIATVNQGIHGWGGPIAYDQEHAYLLAGKNDPVSKIIRKISFASGDINDLDINNSSINYFGIINQNFYGIGAGKVFTISQLDGSAQEIYSGLFDGFDGVGNVQFDDANDKIFFTGIAINSDSTIVDKISEINVVSGEKNTTTLQGRASFLLLPIPEPSAVSLLAIGLGALAMMRRRRS